MIKKIINKIYYNPYKVIKRYNNIVVHPTAVLLKTAKFSLNGKLKNNKINIGSKSVVGCNFIFESDEGDVVVGENTLINGGTKIIAKEKIKIGNNVMIAWDCTLFDNNSHSLDYLDRRKDIETIRVNYLNGVDLVENKNWEIVKSAPITIEDDAWIGFGSTILKGVTIGKGAIVGAKSVVRNNVAPWTIVSGNPAVEIKKHNK